MYLQSPVNAQERLELGPESVFWSWGADEAGVAPTPNPYLERLRDSYRGGTRITIVEGLDRRPRRTWSGSPAIRWPTRATTPRGCLRSSRIVVAGAPGSSGAQALSEPHRRPSRPRVLEALPCDGPAGGAAAWMAASRLAVIPYLDTPFIEAMVIGTPTIGLWNPERWPLRPELEPLMEALRAVGIFHADAASAAAQVERVYDEAVGWWATPVVARAREQFTARFAVPGDPLTSWTGRLRELRR